MLGFCGSWISFGVHHQGVAVGTVRDPEFGSVQDIIVLMFNIFQSFVFKTHNQSFTYIRAMHIFDKTIKSNG